jgi:uncharacterized protein
VTVWSALLLSVAALAAGAINAVAGGGSFLTFPALIFVGVPPLVANATSTAAVWPAAVASALGYREELKREGSVSMRLGLVSAAGGVLGALGVIGTPQQFFVAVLPVLLLIATLVFTFGEALRARLQSLGEVPFWVVVLCQFVVAIYGGYFGGGMGLMMLALFSLLGPQRLHAMNGLKSVLGVAINLTALITFVVAGMVDWPRAGLMAVAASVGGYFGARLAQRVSPRRVKVLVVVLGWTITALFFARTYGHGFSPTNRVSDERAPCAPITNDCSMSAVFEGPARKRPHRGRAESLSVA